VIEGTGGLDPMRTRADHNLGLSCTTTGLVPGDDDHGVAALVVGPGHDLANPGLEKGITVPTEQSCVELHMSCVTNEQFGRVPLLMLFRFKLSGRPVVRA
jgi:hypothetical protein